jgi:PiT family inorganic phosphate transporter
MVAAEVLVLVVLATGASFFTAWTIGAGSSGSTPFAPAVGANAIGTMRAAFIVGILGFLGAVLQGANVTETMGRELILHVSLTPLAATVALLTAALLIGGGVYAGYPIATAFAVAGAVVGVGIGLGGDPAWHKYGEIMALWVLTPFIGAPAAYATAKTLRSDTYPEQLLVPVLAGVVGVIIANMEFLFFGPPGESATFAMWVAGTVGGGLVVMAGASIGVAAVLGGLMYRSVRRDLQRALQRFLLALGALVAFSAGGGKVGLAIGPLLPLMDPLPVQDPLFLVLLIGGIGLLLGSWMAAPRMIKALSQDYSALGPRRSIAVLIPSFAIAQVAIFFGLPMSFNEIFVSAISGSGFAAGAGAVSKGKMAKTVLAWILSLILAFVLSVTAYTALGFFTLG